MRHVLATLFVAVLVFAASNAQAERRMFIISSDADGYGVDRCLSGGAACGKTVANSYCKSHEFAEAASFHKVDRDDITGSIPTSGNGACHGATCDEFVAIVCSR
jgi:hypothetical protein